MHNSEHRNLDIESKYITRLEGHGHLKINVREGQIQELQLTIPESPRFFEAMLKGRHHIEASLIASRICGICAVAHSTASLQATEAAMGLNISELTLLLRKLNMAGEMIQSHILHAYFLVAPDLFNVGSVIPLASSHPEVVKRAIRMRKLGNDLCICIGGRHVHPISPAPSGFLKLPPRDELLSFRKRLEESFEDLTATAELLKTVKLPEFDHPTEYLSLKNSEEYATIRGDIYSSVDGITPLPRYKEKIKEEMVRHSMAKHARGAKGTFMVGALARVNNNYDQLRPIAKKVAADLGLKVPCHNPFMITIAQVVETVHYTEEAIELLDRLATIKFDEEPPRYELRTGQGVGAVEAPRGTLYHDYTYNGQGEITEANCIIPTAQNLANIEYNMYELVPRILDKPQAEITQTLEMLVRAYDPCISCATHFLEVEFV